jgi:tRNA-modifying protein YgfZ
MNEPTETIHAAPLPFLGVLRVGGADAAHFLQGQLTNDVQLLDDGRTQLAGYNTPQGRVIALLRLHKADDAIYALLPADLVERVCTLLRRFVLRSKVDLQVAADLQLGWIASTSGLPSTASTHLVAFDYAPGRRVIAATEDTWRSISGLALAGAQPHGQDEWLAADIRDGQPQVFAAASEAFIPQMLNLDLVGGISFSKGCYTGQEIVARTQNLGRIKRRTFRYRVDGDTPPPPLAGLHLNGAKVAEVLVSAASGGTVELLAVTSLEARDRVLTLEDGRSAAPLDMAYTVP